jgi:hypothetical protein
MKKIILNLILVFTAISGFAQQFKPVKLDSLVSVSLSAGYQKEDTTGEQIYTANGMYGYMVAIRAANAADNTPLKKQSDLNNVLKSYIKSIQGESAGSSAQNVRDTTINSLKAKLFTLKSDDGSGSITNRDFLLLYTQDVTYTFEYVYPDNRADLVADEFKNFISSIRLSPQLNWNDQYLSQATGLSQIAKIGIFGGSGLIVILAVVLISKKRRPALS